MEWLTFSKPQSRLATSLHMPASFARAASNSTGLMTPFAFDRHLAIPAGAHARASPPRARMQRGVQHERVFERTADDLQAGRQSGIRKAVAHRQGGALSQIERAIVERATQRAFGATLRALGNTSTSNDVMVSASSAISRARSRCALT